MLFNTVVFRVVMRRMQKDERTYQRTGSVVTGSKSLHTHAREHKSCTVKNEHTHKDTSSGNSSSMVCCKQYEVQSPAQ